MNPVGALGNPAGLTTRERRLLAVAHHEAGHAVAGVVLGGTLRSATLTNDAAGPSGLTRFAQLDADVNPQMSLAGPWSEIRWATGRRPTTAELWALLDSSANGDYKVLAKAGGVASGDAVVPVLERCWESVSRLARLLYRARRAEHRHVCDALGIRLGDNGFALALIRSGTPPGSLRVSTPSLSSGCHCHTAGSPQ